MGARERVPRLSVIVPCYRDPESLQDLLQSLEMQEAQSNEMSFEVIVVDSGTDDRVVSTAERFGARHLRGDGRLLPGEARNLAARHALAPALAFIDADCVADPGWLGALADGLRTESVLIGGPVLNRHAWHTIASIDNLLQFADYGPDRPCGPIRHVPSCNMAMRREDFLAIGGFEHRGQRSGEDVLLTEAVNARWPGRVVFVPEMRVAHQGRPTLGKMLSHHHGFGYVRGALGLHLSAAQQRWGRWVVVLPAVMLKRLTYICGCGVRYGRISAPELVLTLPLILAGVFAWAIGLRSGLKAAAE